MTKKTLDELRFERDEAQKKKMQAQHQLNRLENRKAYLEKGERAKRTHELCNIGGAVEHFMPMTIGMDNVAAYEFMERLAALPDVQKFLQDWR